MANQDDDDRELDELAQASEQAEGDAAPADPEGAEPTDLGVARYVFFAFFAIFLLSAYLSGKVLAGIWNTLAEQRWAVSAVPALLRLSEDERPNVTMLIGIVLAAVGVVVAFRKPRVRAFADDVAAELTKVTWPAKETVVNGTVIVIVSTAVATVFIGLLDQVWHLITTWIYGA